MYLLPQYEQMSISNSDSIFGFVNIQIQGQHWTLLPEKAVYWHEEKTLFLSDLHLAKDMHFRKNGVAVPSGPTAQTLKTLSACVAHFQPIKMLLLGDLFHSEMNQAIPAFAAWRQKHASVDCILVAGNHDILQAADYTSMGLQMAGDSMLIGPFLFTHEPPIKDVGAYVVCGHLHPAARIRGKGRESMRLPCFWIREKYVVLPAFGEFTGSKTIKSSAKDILIGIADKQLFHIQGKLPVG